MPKETAQRAKKSEAAAGWISRAIMVSFIGDAFGLGFHRYYAPDEMHESTASGSAATRISNPGGIMKG